MADELINIFDREGKKTGTARWSDAHRKGLIHHVADALIFKTDSKKQILLQKRSNQVKQDAGLWQQSVGGHIRTGETPLEGIKRELQEELFAGQSLPKLIINKVGKYFSHDLPGNYEFVHLYEIIYPGPFANFFHKLMEKYRKIKTQARQ